MVTLVKPLNMALLMTDIQRVKHFLSYIVTVNPWQVEHRSVAGFMSIICGHCSVTIAV
jgi:hypothetical protein